jgi:hypothetical protein
MTAQRRAELKAADAETAALFDLLELVLDDDVGGFAQRMGGNPGLLNEGMWFQQPVSYMINEGTTLPMVTSFFDFFGGVAVGFDDSLVDSAGRGLEHFAAASGSILSISMFATAFPTRGFGMLDQSGRSPADYAALMGHAEMLQFLLNADAPNEVRQGKIVLLPLARMGRQEAFSVLLLHGVPISVDPLVIGRFGSARHEACAANKGGLLEQLLDYIGHRVDLLVRNQRGKTMLDCAVRAGSVDCVRLLDLHGIAIKEHVELAWVAGAGHVDLLRYLHTMCDFDLRQETRGGAPLIRALREQQLDACCG